MEVSLGTNYDQIMRDLPSRSRKYAGLRVGVFQCQVKLLNVSSYLPFKTHGVSHHNKVRFFLLDFEMQVFCSSLIMQFIFKRGLGKEEVGS